MAGVIRDLVRRAVALVQRPARPRRPAAVEREAEAWLQGYREGLAGDREATHPDVVEVLEEGLAEAQRRPVLAVAVLMQLPGGVVSTAYTIRGGDGAHLTHALACLQARLTSPDNVIDEEDA